MHLKSMRRFEKDEQGRVTFTYDLAEGVVPYYFNLCGREFLAEFVVGGSEVSLIVLDN
jgi:hypothetical protein